MGRFVIDTDTRRAWKSVGDTRCRASSVASEYLSAHGVEFPGCRARSDGLHHRLTSFGDNTTSTKKRIEIFLLVNSHRAILRRDRDAACSAGWDWAAPSLGWPSAVASVVCGGPERRASLGLDWDIPSASKGRDQLTFS